MMVSSPAALTAALVISMSFSAQPAQAEVAPIATSALSCDQLRERGIGQVNWGRHRNRK